jgi:hypothetical protein
MVVVRAAAMLCLLAAIALGGCGERDRAVGASYETNSTLFLAGIGELWVVDVESEHAVRLRRPEIGAGDPPHFIAAIGDRLAMWDYDVTTIPIADPSAESAPLAEDGWIFIPGADPDRIWVGLLDPESPATERGLNEVREIDSAGNVVTRAEPPHGAWPYAEVGGGLLLQAPRPTLWDPDTGRTLRSWEWEEIGDMGPVSGNLLASSDYESGELIVTDVVSGAQRRIPPPEGLKLVGWEGSFSPDGATLAVPIAESGDFDRGEQELGLIDVESGAIERVPGSRVPPGYVFTAWSRDGEEVYLTGGDRESRRSIIAYRLDDERAKALDVTVGDFYDLAVG